MGFGLVFGWDWGCDYYWGWDCGWGSGWDYEVGVHIENWGDWDCDGIHIDMRLGL